jgi:alpha-amylase/alpha-mannosidase (GH57 family)
MSRAVVLHGHFYQPPRENPWLDYVEAEASAAPYHDWNRRVEQECYRTVAAARLPDPSGRIARIVNTLAWISFDFGPTLLEWLEREAPGTYRAVLDADGASRARTGFGNAIAAPYHHVILPLSSRRDKISEVRWGIADFRRRFRREPEGMWLPETAVDDETLDVLAAHGIAFTIVAPHQVEHAPAAGRPGRYRTGGGRDIALLVYDGPLSHDVAFGPLLQDAYRWMDRVAAAASENDAVVAMAMDGETFGHHHRFGEMALARLLDLVAGRSDVTATNFAAVLAAHPAADRVKLVAPSSWSCPHGVERWRSDCGCRLAPERGWHQRWRAPLRTALTWLAGELHGVFEREGAALFDDPWAVRDAYGETLGEAGTAIGELVAAHAPRPLTAEDAVRARWSRPWPGWPRATRRCSASPLLRPALTCMVTTSAEAATGYAWLTGAPGGPRSSR